MPRYFLKLSYAGTAYHGWQIQENTPVTVQQVMNESISRLLGEKIDLTGCGRTDTGVHAKEFYAHFDSDKNDLHTSTPTDWVYKFNCVLPFDIAVSEIKKVSDEAHARYDAVSRTYHYIIAQQRDPFTRDWSHYVSSELDTELMNNACALLFEYSDFSCFSKSNTQVKTNECKIMEASWKKEEGKLLFSITADRFLRNMVRAVVGTMIEIGKNKMDLDGFRKIIEGKNRGDAGVSVPPQGLYLVNVKYDDGIFNLT